MSTPAPSDQTTTVLLTEGRTCGGRPQAVILLVEDEPVVRQLAVFVLQQENLIVLPTCDAIEALRVARSRIEIDLLLTDVQMDGMDGIELAKLISEERPGTKVLVMSWFPASLISAAKEGFPVLAKPFTPTTLTDQIRHVLATSIPGQSKSKPKKGKLLNRFRAWGHRRGV